MADVKKFSEVDLYKLIGVQIDATDGEIRKAYRKAALSCHPDKCPDNPKAAELFHELAKALEILSDPKAREAYDRLLKAKKASQIRTQLLDSKRQKLKSDLEAREKAAQSSLNKKKDYNVETRTEEEIFKAEVDRLRKEGSKLIEEEKELMHQELMKERERQATGNARYSSWDSSKHRIKIKWAAEKGNSSNGGYNQELLNKFLQKYGDIVALLVSSKKVGSAIVEFKEQEAAEMAVEYEKGNMENPLQLEWIGDAPKKRKTGTSITETDFESLVLRGLRQAEERKRLIEKMMQEDDDG